jgi:hypothetical protein
MKKKKKTKKSRKTDNTLIKAFDAMEQIIGLTNAFCLNHLNEEYYELCEELAWEAFEAGLPVEKGRPAGWASGIVHAIGFVNFLQDPTQSPHMTSSQIAEGFGVSQQTMQAKSKTIRDELDIIPMDPDWCLPSLLEDNPLVWIVETSAGFVTDVRLLPREVQEQAYQLGLIPYIPADRPEAEKNSGKGAKIIEFPSEHKKSPETRPVQKQKDDYPDLFDDLKD